MIIPHHLPIWLFPIVARYHSLFPMLLNHHCCFLDIPLHWPAWFIFSHHRSLLSIILADAETSLLIPELPSSLTSIIHHLPPSLVITNYSRCFCSIAAVSSAFLIIDKHDSSFPIIARYKIIAAAETSLLFPEHSSSLTSMIYSFSSSLVIINYGRCCCSITAAS